jgi:hypothetical protein
MFVNMIPVHVVQMTVMNIVNVAIMTDRRMAAGRSVLMGMVGMVLLGTGGHRFLFLVFCDKTENQGSSSFGGVPQRTLHQLKDMVVRNGIEDMLGLSPPFHKPHGMEHLETGGYGRKLLVFEVCEFRDADFSLANPRQQPEARRVSERSKHSRSAFKLMALGQLRKGPGRAIVLATALVRLHATLRHSNE